MIKCPMRSMYVRHTRYTTSKHTDSLPEISYRFTRDKKDHWIVATLYSYNALGSKYDSREYDIMLGRSIHV